MQEPFMWFWEEMSGHLEKFSHEVYQSAITKKAAFIWDHNHGHLLGRKGLYLL